MDTDKKSLANPVDLSAEERALMLNDLSRLSPEQRSSLYVKVCQSVGLNPLTQPFQYLELNGKLTFYASRNCTDQLRKLNEVSLVIASREKIDGMYVVTARATLPGGRTDESIAAVDLMEPDRVKMRGEWKDNPRRGKQLSGDTLANAIMKCETKAKRRVTLSICGLSFMDETEVETVKEAKVVEFDQAHGAQSVAQLSSTPVQVQEEHPPMPTAEFETAPAVVEEPCPTDSFAAEWTTWKVPFGRKYYGRTLAEIGVHEATKYADWLKDSAKKSNKNVSGDAAKFCELLEMMARDMAGAYNTMAPSFDSSEAIPF